MSNLIDPMSRMIRGVKGEFDIVREVSEKTGISENTIRKAIRNGVAEMMPSKTTANGKIYLFTPEDIDRIASYHAHLTAPKDFDGEMSKSGRPRKYSDEERLERSRLHSQANYWKRRMVEAETKDERKRAQDKYAEVRSKLHGDI